MATARRLIGNIRGPQGIQGPQGEQGIQGPTGPTGPTGSTGATPNISIGTVTDVPHGTPSSATMTGTPEAPVLNLNLQSGASGNETIDDTAGIGDTDLVWSADKSAKEVSDLKSAIDEKADSILKTIDTPASIITIEDGADDLPVKELKIAIEPVQDLHGYDHPWPAGGGVNKFVVERVSVTSNAGITAIINDDLCSITINGTATKNGSIDAVVSGGKDLPYGDYYYHCDDATNRRLLMALRTGGQSQWINSGNVVTVGDNDYPQYFHYTFSEGDTFNNKVVKLQLNNPATVTEWTPYSNICPITGWDSANVWDDPAYGGSIDWNQLKTKQNLSITDNKSSITSNNDGKYTITVTENGASRAETNDLSFTTVTGHVYYMTFNNPDMWVVLKKTGTAYKTRKIHKVVNGGYNNVAITFENLNVGTYVGYLQIFDLTKMFGSVVADSINDMEAADNGAGVAWFRNLFPKDYYEYNTGEVTTVSAVNGDPYRHVEYEFPTEAGTVYGGELTIHADGTGELVATHGYFVDDGSANWAQNPSGSFYLIGQSTNVAANSDGITNYSPYVYSNSAQYSIFARPNGQITISYGWGAVWPDVASLKQAFAQNPLQVVWPLATPITYQLTAPQVRTLLGIYNNIWADTGNINLLTYPVDTSIRVDNVDNRITSVLSAMVAPVLTGMIADTALAVNQFRIVNDTLYKVTAPIASGGTLTPGTNVIATSIGEQITALLNA